MSTLTQDADQIIAEEGLDNVTPAVAPDEPPKDDQVTPDEPVEKDVEKDPAEGEPKPESEEPPKDTPGEPKDAPSSVVNPRSVQTDVTAPKFDESKVFDEQGNVREFKEVVDVGQYLSEQVKPVEVTGKDGKTYQFYTIKDLEEQFPDGFEAKNDIEKLRFESAIVANDNKFKEAVNSLVEAESEYSRYANEAVQARESNVRIASEYRAMADKGLVPKVGDPNDPKFGESEAVKELNNILEWMNNKNTELKKDGLGEITSLYVAKQMMDGETKADDKKQKVDQVIQERREVASLSSSPSPDEGKKAPVADIPLSRLADHIIAEEGLR